MGTGTALLISSIISAAGAVGGAVVEKKALEKSGKLADIRSAKELEAQKALASQVTAPITGVGGQVELQSLEAKEDEEIRSRSVRSRLKIARKGKAAGGIGTGLKVG